MSDRPLGSTLIPKRRAIQGTGPKPAGTRAFAVTDGSTEEQQRDGQEDFQRFHLTVVGHSCCHLDDVICGPSVIRNTCRHGRGVLDRRAVLLGL